MIWFVEITSEDNSNIEYQNEEMYRYLLSGLLLIDKIFIMTELPID